MYLFDPRSFYGLGSVATVGLVSKSFTVTPSDKKHYLGLQLERSSYVLNLIIRYRSGIALNRSTLKFLIELNIPKRIYHDWKTLKCMRMLLMFWECNSFVLIL